MDPYDSENGGPADETEGVRTASGDPEEPPDGRESVRTADSGTGASRREPVVGTVATHAGGSGGDDGRLPRIPGAHRRTTRNRIVGLVLVAVFFGVAFLVGRGVLRGLEAVVDVDQPGTAPRLVAGVIGLQVVGFGTIVVSYLAHRNVPWMDYLRVGDLTQWTVTYGVFVGMAMMILTSAATVLYDLLELTSPEPAVEVAEPDPLFFVVLFLVSTLVAVPLEELFFRGVIQRRLEESFHPGLAISVASLLFVLIHTPLVVETGGELLFVLLYLSFGIVLGVSYYLTDDLFVPIIGHAMFNGIQILVAALEFVL